MRTLKVLFYTPNEVSPQKGGTERITASISFALQQYFGVECYSMYSFDIDSIYEKTPFKAKINIANLKKEKERLYEFILNYDIDIIVNQGFFSYSSIFHEVLQEFNGKYLVFVHHFNPGAEINFLLFHAYWLELKQKKSVFKNIIKMAIYPFRKFLFQKNLPIIYRNTYNMVDRFVLLSSHFIDDFVNFSSVKHTDKIRVIHNALSYNSFFDMRLYVCKKKEVLIVSRLEECQKRISLALKIWEYIEKDSNLEDWTLNIVGSGLDEFQYKNYVYSHSLKRVKFHGIQNPISYYKNASIFMMTSAFEGWGLTLTEAQQYACVPIAFNSYKSLSDIITDGENGYIVPNDDIDEFVSYLKRLMLGDNLRQKMANTAVESSHRFEVKKIAGDWMQLFNGL